MTDFHLIKDFIPNIYNSVEKSYYNHDEDVDSIAAEIIIAKHRNGTIGSIDLQFDSSHVQFQNGSRYFPQEREIS